MDFKDARKVRIGDKIRFSFDALASIESGDTRKLPDKIRQEFKDQMMEWGFVEGEEYIVISKTLESSFLDRRKNYVFEVDGDGRKRMAGMNWFYRTS